MELESTRQFFDAGLHSYGKALLAIHEFRDLLEEELQRLMAAQPSESRLMLADKSALSLADERLFTIGSGVPPALYFSVIAALAQRVQGTETATRARLEVGVWWSPPFSSTEGVAIYAGILNVPWA